MILHTDATTPFGRKCMVAAMERGIAMEERFIDLSAPASFLDVNPLNQIPALTTSEDEHLFDSDVILQYLDTLHQGSPLVAPEDRFGTLTRIHLANGVIEATLLRIGELRRPGAQQNAPYIAKLEARVGRGLTALAAGALPAAAEPLSGADIVTACALEYVDFRYPHDWRTAHTDLAGWHSSIADRPSLAATRPTRSEPLNYRPG